MKNEKKDILKKYMINSLISIVVWTLLILGIFMLLNLYFDLADFQWIYDISSDVYYSLKNNYINNNLLFISGFIIWVMGILFILIRLIFKFRKFILSLEKAINEIYSKEVDYIELPRELEELQQKLNRLKREAEKNERLAKETEQRKNDLIVYLAHDLKTPLTSVIGYLSLLEEIKDMPQKQREKYIKTVLDKAYRLEDLINELFDIARFNSETIMINKEDLDLTMMLAQLVDDFYPLLKETDKEIKLKTNEKIMIKGDSDKLARVFSNIITNAIYYSKDRIIKIEIIKNSQNVRIEFINKGVIPESKLEKIFEKFYRADYSRNTNTGSGGLGLAIAKEIVELHGGKIGAICEDDNTKFWIELPDCR